MRCIPAASRSCIVLCLVGFGVGDSGSVAACRCHSQTQNCLWPFAGFPGEADSQAHDRYHGARGESCDLKELVAKFIPESIGREIEKACQGIYPLQNVFIRKAKILKAPKFDITKLMEVHQGGDAAVGNAVGDRLDRPDLIPEADAPVEIEGAYLSLIHI